MNNVDKINLILKDAGVSKVNLSKYLGVSRQMIYNYFEKDDLSNMPEDKCQLLFKLLDIVSVEDLKNITITDEYISRVSSKIFKKTKQPEVKKTNEVVDVSGVKKEEQEIISDIVFVLKELLNEDKTKVSFATLKYLYQFIQSLSTNKELKFFLEYVSKSNGFTEPLIFTYDEEKQYIFESIMFSALTLYNNGGASRSKLAESHKRWENELSRKKEEKLSRTQELNTAKVLGLRELGYDEINEKNASEVFDKIAEITSRKINDRYS